MLSLAKKHDFVKGVMGWIDLKDTKLEKTLELYKGNPYLKGFRDFWFLF